MHKGQQSSKPLHTNRVQSTFDATNQRAGEPVNEQMRISYGIICEVDEENSRVRVDVFDRGGKRFRLGAGDDRLAEGAFVPVMQPITVIHQLYGKLRKGLIVRVFWRGRHFPTAESIVEIISDGDSSAFAFGKKKPRSNELSTQPHQIFTGGVKRV